MFQCANLPTMPSLKHIPSPSRFLADSLNSVPSPLTSFRGFWKEEKRHCHLLRLPLDIHILYITTHLNIWDVLSLRQTCTTLYRITLEPIIWKKLLRRMQLPHSPLRPSLSFGDPKTDFEFEQTVIRAFSLDDNWRSPRPDGTKLRNCANMDLRKNVHDLVLLPGGKYLVASTRDRSGYRYSVEVYCVDRSRWIAMATLSTRSQAIQLRARYMQYDGKKGIMIAYIERCFIAGEGCGLNAADYSPEAVDLDPPYPLQYDISVQFISLDKLDRLSDVFHVPEVEDFPTQSPFQEIYMMRSTKRLDHPQFFYDFHYELHYLAFIVHPDTIHLQCIESFNNTFKLRKLLPDAQQPNRPISINAFHMPSTGEITVIRTLTGDGQLPLSVIEQYPWPSRTFQPNRSVPYIHGILPEQREVLGENISHLRFAESPMVRQEPVDHPHLFRDFSAQPPISFFGQQNTGDSMLAVHWCIWPTYSVNFNEVQYRFPLDTLMEQWAHETGAHRFLVLPGIYRSIACAVPSDNITASPPVLRLERYVCREWIPLDYKEYTPAGWPQETDDYMHRVHIPYEKLYQKLELPEELSRSLSAGLIASCWDEALGRLCLITRDRPTELQVVDFAIIQPPNLADRFQSPNRML